MHSGVPIVTDTSAIRAGLAFREQAEQDPAIAEALKALPQRFTEIWQHEEIAPLIARSEVEYAALQSSLPEYVGQFDPLEDDEKTRIVCKMMEVDPSTLTNRFQIFDAIAEDFDVAVMRQRREETAARIVRSETTEQAHNGADVLAIVTAVGGETAARILAIGNQWSKTVDNRQREIYALDRDVIGWTAGRWAEVLRGPDGKNITAAAARKTKWWRSDRKRLRAD
jgi:hypothetical protein